MNKKYLKDYPKILKEWDFESNEKDPYDIPFSSHSIAWWKCEKGHSYQMEIRKKTVRGFGCPVCSNRRIEQGFNDLATIYPEIAKEWHPTKNGDLLPTNVGRNYSKKVWWLCDKGHEWQATPHDRTNDKTGCPICSSRRGTSFPEQAIFYYIKQLYPDSINRYKNIFDNGMELDVYIPSIRYAIEYDGRLYHRTKEEHDRELLKYQICKSNGIHLLRIKEKHDDSWNDTSDDVIFIKKSRNYKILALQIQRILNALDFNGLLKRYTETSSEIAPISFDKSSVIVDLERDRPKILSYLTDIKNSLTKMRPGIAEQWDYERNKPLTPEMFSPGSNENVWWICTKCGKSYLSSISKKTRLDTRLCPSCATVERGKNFTKKKVKIVGSLRETNPELAKEWHPTKNGNLTPDDVTAGRSKPVWWICSKCGYEYEQSPNSRKSGSGCPHCAGRVPITGVDDLLTVRPDLCKEWDYNKNTIDPSKLLPGSGKRVWWICSKCGHEWQTFIYNRKNNGCPRCGHKKRKSK